MTFWNYVATAAVILVSSSLPIRASGQGPAAKGTPDPKVVELQVRLDRAGFSPGEIDGRMGANTERALAAFERARAGTASGAGGPASGQAPQGDAAELLTTYTVTPQDVAGPFTPDIPDDMMAKARLDALHYSAIAEALGERFHVAPALLEFLNPGVRFVAGETIRVPNVIVTSDAPAKAIAARVVVSKRESVLTVLDAAGIVIFHAPVTSGSEFDPLPIGEWTVTGISRNPTFNYNPKLFWDADPSHAKAKIPAGPNGPVGVVWIDINKEHYGLHGTPEPGKVGHQTSHGCVRLTNWDAQKLATLVAKGTPVVFTE